MHLYILASKQQETNLGNISNAHARSLKSKFLLSVQEDHSEQTLRAHRLVYGVCGRKSEERSFQLCSYPLWAMLEEIKKQKREKERTKEFEANIKHNICIFYLVVRFRMVSFRGQRKLGPLPGTGESCKCFHQYSRIVALQP